MNPTIKDAAVMRYRYDALDQLRRHFSDFADAYVFLVAGSKPPTASPLRIHLQTIEPKRFNLNLLYPMAALNTRALGPLELAAKGAKP